MMLSSHFIYKKKKLKNKKKNVEYFLNFLKKISLKKEKKINIKKKIEAFKLKKCLKKMTRYSGKVKNKFSYFSFTLPNNKINSLKKIKKFTGFKIFEKIISNNYKANFSLSCIEISDSQLIRLNGFLGDSQKFWNLTTSIFFLGVRHGHIIINLNLTKFNLRQAINFLIHISFVPRSLIFFVNDAINKTKEINSFFFCFKHGFFNSKWRGGTISNYKTIWFFLYKPLTYLKKIPSKKRFLISIKKRRKMVNAITNFYKFRRLPTALISLKTSSFSINESFFVKIPSIALLDAGRVSKKIDYPIILNDDSNYGSLVYTQLFRACIILGKLNFLKRIFYFSTNLEIYSVIFFFILKKKFKFLSVAGFEPALRRSKF
jgi:ribosomal protein S2